MALLLQLGHLAGRFPAPRATQSLEEFLGVPPVSTVVEASADDADSDSDDEADSDEATEEEDAE